MTPFTQGTMVVYGIVDTINNNVRLAVAKLQMDFLRIIVTIN